MEPLVMAFLDCPPPLIRLMELVTVAVIRPSVFSQADLDLTCGGRDFPPQAMSTELQPPIARSPCEYGRPQRGTGQELVLMHPDSDPLLC